jgi:hypothetical protein
MNLLVATIRDIHLCGAREQPEATFTIDPITAAFVASARAAAIQSLESRPEDSAVLDEPQTAS